MTDLVQSWKPTVCIYHGGCIDGFTAAWVVWRKWGDDVRSVGAVQRRQYQHTPRTCFRVYRV